VTASIAWPSFRFCEMEPQVDNQVAAPAEREHLTCTERIKTAHQSAEGRLATVVPRRKRKTLPDKKTKDT
jgi:hypothetical protein